MKQKNITKMFLFITFMVLLIGVVSATEVSDDTISTEAIDTTDTVDIDKSVSNKNMKGHLKVSAKTYDVNDFDTLHNALTNDTYDTVNINIKSDITLKNNTNVNKAIKTLNIEGNAKTINGNNTYQFLNITSGTITINNIKIINCNSTKGGAIYNNGSNLGIKNSLFNNNTARQGGSIYSYNGNLTITFSYFKNNTASGLEYEREPGRFINIWGYSIFVDKGNLICKNNSFFADYKYREDNIYTVLVNNTQFEGNIWGNEIVFTNSMNVINGKYVLTTKVIKENLALPGRLRFSDVDYGRVSYTLDGKWIGSINVRNSGSWIVFNVLGVGNHTIVATYIDSNGIAKSTDIFTFEKIADVNLLFNQISFKNGAVTVVNCLKDDLGNNVNDGRISYSLNGKWIGSTGVKNGSSMIKFNHTYQKAILKATYITNSNVSQNIYTKIIDLDQFDIININPRPNIIINSMNVINGKYVLTTTVHNIYTGYIHGRVSYTLDGKWIGSISVRNEESWIVFDVPSVGNHTIVATYIDLNGKAKNADTFTFEKIADVNLLFNQINVKNGAVTVVNCVKDDLGNNINNGRISYSFNGKWIGSTGVKNGSSKIKFNYTNTTNTLKATYITNNNTQENIYTKTMDAYIKSKFHPLLSPP